MSGRGAVKRYLLISMMVLAMGLLMVGSASACSSGCSGNDCASEPEFWVSTSSNEVQVIKASATRDAGLYVGMVTRDRMQQRGLLGVLFEYEEDGSLPVEVHDAFVHGFLEHVNYLHDQTVAVRIERNPADPWHLKPAAVVHETTGMDVLVTCRLVGGQIQIENFKGNTGEVALIRKTEHALASFRVMITDIARPAEPPMFIDEVQGGCMKITEYALETSENRLIYEETAWDHFPGLNEYHNLEAN